MRAEGRLAVIVVAMGMAACSELSQQEQNALSGGAIGAAGGAVIGTAIGAGPVVGAAIGGATGAMISAWTSAPDAQAGGGET